jgi:hypothetical protein
MKASPSSLESSAELRLGKRHITDYGKRYEGVVATEEHDIPVTWREPPKGEQSGRAYVLATGWFGKKDSMRMPAHAAVRAGHGALTFDYTNTRLDHPLERNAADFAAVINEVPADMRYVIALSMSGGILVDALVQARARVQAATAVAAAGYIRGDHSLMEAAQHLGATTPEVISFGWKSPFTAARLGATTLLHSVSRGPAIAAEFEAMREDRDPANLYAVTSAPNPPFMRFLYGSGDQLFPPEAQAEASSALPFNHREMYQGGHLALVHDIALPRHIFALDDQQVALGEPLPMAA